MTDFVDHIFGMRCRVGINIRLFLCFSLQRLVITGILALRYCFSVLDADGEFVICASQHNVKQPSQSCNTVLDYIIFLSVLFPLCLQSYHTLLMSLLSESSLSAYFCFLVALHFTSVCLKNLHFNFCLGSYCSEDLTCHKYHCFLVCYG